MNSVLAEVYSTVLPAAPYVVAAYVLILLAVGGYVFFIARKVSDIERQIDVLEQALAARIEAKESIGKLDAAKSAAIKSSSIGPDETL
jgi:CcmD family protein